MNLAIRPPAVAGQFYSASAEQLGQTVDELLAGVTASRETVKAVIAPHAGYRFSGATAARALGATANADYDRIVLIGPTHHVHFRGVSACPADAYETPLGQVPVDVKARDTLVKGSSLLCERGDVHRPEHANEVMLPFLQRLHPKAPILPLVVGHIDWDDCVALAEALAPLWDDPKTLFVISSDFTHFGDVFRFVPFPARDAKRRIEAFDGQAIAPILDGDRAAFTRVIDETQATVCGQRPIATLLRLCETTSHDIAFLEYQNSGQVSGDYRTCVGYAAIQVTARTAGSSSITSGDSALGATLLALARDAIATGIDHREPDAPSGLPTSLYEHGACFVTLRKSGDLRGCIGSLSAHEPLIENLIRNARNAAFQDPRFDRVGANELPDLHIDISILTPPRPIQNVNEFLVGVHGILIEHRKKRGVFLPEVAVTQGWDKSTTLEQVSRKAGLGSNDWKASDAALSVFRTIVFEEA